MEVQRSGRVHIMIHLIGVAVLKVLGWKVEGTAPDVPKVVVIVAYHTTNWDYLVAICISWYFRVKGAWFGKAELFDWPLIGRLFPKTGGIPVYRDRPQGLVEQIVNAFNEREQIMLVLTPEGTRKKSPHWHSGFYSVALQAKVPLSLGYLDYKRKVGGFGPLFYPTGNVEQDLEHLRHYYAAIRPRYPDRVGPIKFKDGEWNNGS
jgi:1-acyl-sn-glycerol-3-phosphate acyltransferase